jgi:hypothetical protein
MTTKLDSIAPLHAHMVVGVKIIVTYHIFIFHMFTLQVYSLAFVVRSHISLQSLK